MATLMIRLRAWAGLFCNGLPLSDLLSFLGFFFTFI